MRMINPTLIYNGVTQVQKWDFSTFTAIKCVQLSEPKLGEEPPVLASLEPLFKNSLCSLQSIRNQLSLQVYLKKFNFFNEKFKIYIYMIQDIANSQK
jgi:hypothetical protein